MYLEDRAAAHQLGQIAAAKGAADSLAKLHGLWIERSEHKYKYESLTDAELDAAVERLLAGLTRKEKSDLRELLIEKERRFRRTRLSRYVPYPKQSEFHAAGAKYRERLFMAANRCGKTECGAAEMAFHLTGQYPGWWEGKRFDKAVRAWAAGITNEKHERRGAGEVARSAGSQGRMGNRHDSGRSTHWRAGLGARRREPDRYCKSVKHVSGDTSMLQFKSYERGRETDAGGGISRIRFSFRTQWRLSRGSRSEPKPYLRKYIHFRYRKMFSRRRLAGPVLLPSLSCRPKAS
jgi:phage terminase large subunit-like protein